MFRDFNWLQIINILKLVKLSLLFLCVFNSNDSLFVAQ